MNTNTTNTNNTTDTTATTTTTTTTTAMADIALPDAMGKSIDKKTKSATLDHRSVHEFARSICRVGAIYLPSWRHLFAGLAPSIC